MNKNITSLRSHKKLVLRLSIVGIILISIVIAILVGSIPEKVRNYDNVQIDYTMWESDERMYYSYSDPILNDTFWVRMIPITRNHTDGLILGLYNNLLGKELYYESDMIWLDSCVD